MKHLLFLTDYYESDDLKGWFLAEACQGQYHVEVRGFRRRVTSSMRWRRPLAYWEYLRLAAYALSRRKHVDCMIFWAATNGILVAFLARLLRLDIPKLILVNLVLGKKQGVRQIYDLMLRMGLQKVTAITVSSRDAVGIYTQRFGFRERFHFIPDAIYTFDHRRGQQGHFIFSGGASFRDWYTLIEAARRVPEKRFLIVAGGPNRWLKQPGLPRNVEVSYFADVPRSEFDQTLSEAEFVVIPLLYEDVPGGQFTLMHAMEYGKAIIATSTIGTREYVEDGASGLLVKAQDVDDLVSKIKLLSNDNDMLNRLGENAKAAVKQYDVNHFAKEFLRLLSRVLDGEQA